MIPRFLVALLALLTAGSIAATGMKNAGAPAQPQKFPRGSDWREKLVRKGVQELHGNRLGQKARRFSFMRGKLNVMPETMRHAISTSVGGVSQLGLQFRRSQLMPTGIGIAIWVTEGDGVTCISIAKDGSTSCDTSLHAWRQGLPLEVFSPGTSPSDPPTNFLVLGVVPNWANAVRVRIGNQSRRLQAPQGVYALRADSPIRIVGMLR